MNIFFLFNFVFSCVLNLNNFIFMKKMLLSLALLSVFASCQRTQYASIPAPKFEHFESTPVAPKAATAVAVETPITVEAAAPTVEAMAEATATTSSVAETKAAATSTETKVAPKLTFKQRVLAKVVSRKLQKMQRNAPNAEGGKTNTLALVSAIAGVLGLVLFFVLPGVGILLSLGAIILGFVGKSQIKKNDERGMGLAITGIVTGFLTFFILLLAVAFIASLLAGAN
ncbi:MAG: DUF4190 domain-containing protein [Cytophagia bacterium]|nr:MAG: DUF4190 domain-containing protein [Runella sp.]TAG18253.1 MAG: DUF4190 domain-containing protein [Cytophagales bacterium]TAG39850.1 MAG: DUF4190 domain-containing protein [Cytophagia bacterium]TAG52665.1 MAG: DUF4190 domain-containing protein [Runella slithyformis]TAG72599.1 MAG: DUF4190 domain-containing protein [Runella slithyformis]